MSKPKRIRYEVTVPVVLDVYDCCRIPLETLEAEIAHDVFVGVTGGGYHYETLADGRRIRRVAGKRRRDGERGGTR